MQPREQFSRTAYEKMHCWSRYAQKTYVLIMRRNLECLWVYTSPGKWFIYIMIYILLLELSIMGQSKQSLILTFNSQHTTEKRAECEISSKFELRLPYLGTLNASWVMPVQYPFPWVTVVTSKYIQTVVYYLLTQQGCKTSAYEKN